MQTRQRTTSPAPAPAPAPNPAPNPAAQTRTALPVDRPSAELIAERSTFLTEADGLLSRSRTAQLSAEETARLEVCVSSAERLQTEIGTAQLRERAAALNAANVNPTRPAVAPHTAPVISVRSGPDQAEGLRLWLRSHTAEPDLTPDARHRAGQAGFALGAHVVKVNCDYGGTINKAKRQRSLSKGGVGLGKETIPLTYSDKVTEYLTYFSPLLGMVESETTNDGNDRVYFVIDDTALTSSYMTASGGTETAPTIPDKDVTTASVTIKCFDITSGYQKITWQATRDSAVNLEDKISMANSNAHARRMEQAVILGAGGTTEPQGLVGAATLHGTAVNDIDLAKLWDVYFAMPKQYRDQAVWVGSDAVFARLRKKLTDTTGRPLWEPNIQASGEPPLLLGKPAITSVNMGDWTANAVPLMFVCPNFYQLRLVAGHTFQVLVEKFAPHLAFLGIMSFGGAWLGPSTAALKIQLSATPAA